VSDRSAAPDVQQAPALALHHGRKHFGATRALADASLALLPGEIHVLAGENGAGKSTLIKVISGVEALDGGVLEIAGAPRRFASPADAQRAGIAVIHQETSLVATLSVLDNIWLGHERTRFGGRVDRAQERDRAAALCARVGVEVDLDAPVGELAIGVRQLVEIAKALALDARILLLDEPTSALDDQSSERLFACLGALRGEGRAIAYITHRMAEIYRLADRITVLRDGVSVLAVRPDELPPPALVRAMIGRELADHYPARAPTLGAPRLVVEGLSAQPPHARRPPDFASLSFDVRAGEILGVAGLPGSGREALFRSLFAGAPPIAGGTIAIDGRPFSPSDPSQSVDRGLVFVPQDRQRDGLHLDLTCAQNAGLAELRKGPLLRPFSPARSDAAATRWLEAAALPPPMWSTLVRTLSGGNQQKVLFAKALAAGARVLLCEEPTRGVDVGARYELYRLLFELTAQGLAVLLSTSDLDELLALSDRVLVLSRGRREALLSRGEATAERVTRAALGAAA
jgi:ABC-type sugar transport system ATPase subunit